ncbi:MAG: DUF1579 domain-containing protein [Gammaproteobacteria bacterium]|nr:DUF1579 domain-containing protein [Gammaproteobacteria bacterium]
MSLPSSMASLTGPWAGTKKLWLEPGTPVRESSAQANVAVAANGKFLHIGYTWNEKRIQHGVLIIGLESDGKRVGAAWIDSWHNGDPIMTLQGEVSTQGAFKVTGAYPAPPGPDWGWRIEVHPNGSDSWQLLMFNVTPQGEEAKAVEVEFRPV